MVEDTLKASAERHLNRLLRAYCDRSSVVIRYASESEPEPSDFVLFPNRIFERNDSVYVEGWSACKPKSFKLYLQRSAKVRVFQVDRIVDITERQLFGFSLMGYVVNKIVRRGVATGVRGLLLDLILVLLIASMVFKWVL
jgi:predicted DNA-binding transcriptional regulator YafY